MINKLLVRIESGAGFPRSNVPVVSICYTWTPERRDLFPSLACCRVGGCQRLVLCTTGPDPRLHRQKKLDCCFSTRSVWCLLKYGKPEQPASSSCLSAVPSGYQLLSAPHGKRQMKPRNIVSLNFTSCTGTCWLFLQTCCLSGLSFERDFLESGICCSGDARPTSISSCCYVIRIHNCYVIKIQSNSPQP